MRTSPSRARDSTAAESSSASGRSVSGELFGMLERVAQKALETVRRPVRLDGHRIVVSASVGIVQHTQDGRAGANVKKE